MTQRDVQLSPRHRELGFSLIEGLIAAGLLLIVAVGILPLFTQAIRSNATGQSTTMATNAIRSSFETYLSRSFGDVELTLPVGTTTRDNVAFWVGSTDPSAPIRAHWRPGMGTSGDQPDPAFMSTWRSTATVREFQMASIELAADPLAIIPMTAPTPLTGGGDPSFVHLKEIEVELTNLGIDLEQGRVSPIGGTWGQRVRILKAY